MKLKKNFSQQMSASWCDQLNEGVIKLTKRKSFCHKIFFVGMSVCRKFKHYRGIICFTFVFPDFNFFYICLCLGPSRFERPPVFQRQFILDTAVIIWSWFLVQMCKIMISPEDFFIFFQNFDFPGCYGGKRAKNGSLSPYLRNRNAIFLISKDFSCGFKRTLAWLCQGYDCIVFSYNCMFLSCHVQTLEWIYTL